MGRKELGIKMTKRRGKVHAESEKLWLENALKRRRGKPGFASNVAAIEARLALVNAELAK